jgi:hypothetical protein
MVSARNTIDTRSAKSIAAKAELDSPVEIARYKRNSALPFCFAWLIEKSRPMRDKSPARTNRRIDEAH